jgi:hypothetical protein
VGRKRHGRTEKKKKKERKKERKKDAKRPLFFLSPSFVLLHPLLHTPVQERATSQLPAPPPPLTPLATEQEVEKASKQGKKEKIPLPLPTGLPPPLTSLREQKRFVLRHRTNFC